MIKRQKKLFIKKQKSALTKRNRIAEKPLQLLILAERTLFPDQKENISPWDQVMSLAQPLVVIYNINLYPLTHKTIYYEII